MKIKNVLVLYKKSAYKIYFQDRSEFVNRHKSSIVKKEIHRFKKADQQHYAALKRVNTELLSRGIKFSESYRGRKIDYSPYDVVVTVGGDGTFLEAARNCEKQIVIGVNSSPEFSVGRYCQTSSQNFGFYLDKLLSGNCSLASYHRLRLKIDSRRDSVDVLNDLLICHKNPAVLCRYLLKAGGISEEQRSSGMWISTATGSSGAIKSAGGRRLKPLDKKMQYLPRELYFSKDRKYQSRGGVLNSRQKIKITSLMRRGMIYVDGAHLSLPFNYGDEAAVSISPSPIRTIKP